MKKTLNLILKPFGKKARAQAGMTIIEILIVIALIGTIMTIVMTNVLQKSDEAKVDLARIAASQLENALRLYKLNNNKFPTTDEGLQALLVAPGGAKNWRGPYTEADKLKDPWGNDFSYESTSAKSFKIRSAGQDTEMNNEDDVIYPPEAPSEAAPAQ
ncbi:MAG: type II secretion system major pseudopilin GspG [Bdellovibrionota bacterium]